MSEHLLLSIAVFGPPLALRLIHLPPLPIEARRETSVATAIFWQLLMDAGNTNERFNDSQAVLVSAMIAYMFSIYQWNQKHLKTKSAINLVWTQEILD